MKTRYLKLMSIFMAIIGLNAAALVGYVLIYSQLVDKYPQVSKKESFDIIAAQTDLPSNTLASEAPDTFQNNIFQSDTKSVTEDNNTSDHGTDYSYNPAKQQIFEELQTQKEELFQEQPPFPSAQSVQNNFSSDSDASSIYVPVQNIQETLPPTQNSQEQAPAVSNSSDTAPSTTIVPESLSSENNAADSSGQSGNSDNFHTYYNPHLQQTTDKYVLNTDSHIFHLPHCNDVVKMAEKNWTTSNNSYDNLIASGYKACGHCLKNYTGDISSTSDSSNYAGNSDISDVPDTTVNSQTGEITFIINEKERYFHIPNNSNCKYLAMTQPQDSRATTESFDELRSQGYHPCRHCGL